MEIDEKKWFSMEPMRDMWHFFSFDKRLVDKKTRFQKVDILHSKYFGKILFLDYDIQSAEYDENVYHECLVQPAMLHHPNPKRVLILGGGEGATLREVLKHKSVEKAVMIDIDEELVDMCKKHLPEWHRNSFSDPRAEALFMDAFRFLRETKEKFDVVIEDLLSPDLESSTTMFKDELFDGIKRVLAPRAIVVFQAGRTDLNIGTGVYFDKFAGILLQKFKAIKRFHAFIPSFCFTWGYLLASDSEIPRLSAEEIDSRIKERNLKLDFYSGFTEKLVAFFPKFGEVG